MKEVKGITLIALVVTIVVLLILAGVSISMLSGENGIITQASKAKIETRAGEVEEEIKMWQNEKMALNYDESWSSDVETETEFIERLKIKELVKDDEIDEINKTITIGDKVINYGEEPINITIYYEYYDENSDEWVEKIYTEIKYIEGMTWQDFVNSRYNDAVQFKIDSENDYERTIEVDDLKWYVLCAEERRVVDAYNTIQKSLKYTFMELE